jgi:hypothetical protein
MGVRSIEKCTQADGYRKRAAYGTTKSADGDERVEGL